MSRHFCLRMYEVAPGRLDRLLERFRDHAVRIFAAHGLETVGLWYEHGAGDAADRLVYLLAAPDAAAYERAWKAFLADPEWARVKEETELDGPLTVARQAIMLEPAAFSPLV
jgi:hypothetical protein